MTTRTPPPPELKQFNTEVQFLLKPQNPRARSLHSFIKRTLRQFNLEDVFVEMEIFNQAYLRGVLLTQSGVAIQSPRAWLRTTAFNIIREHSRYSRRHPAVQYDECLEANHAKIALAVTPAEKWQVDEEAIAADIQAVNLSLQELKPRDRRVIELKAIQNLSWKEVSDRLVALGEAPQTDAALRKRGQRAMERLRQLYHQKRPANHAPSDQTESVEELWEE